MTAPGRWRALTTAALALLVSACATAPHDGASSAAADASRSAVQPALGVAAAPKVLPPAALPERAPDALDPLRPDTRIDLDSRGARTDLWARVRNGMAMPDLDDELVRKHERWYAGRPDYVQRMTERGARYLFYIVEEVDRRGMPMELALLPFIESAFNPQAVSSAKAAGMWQFMPATGRHFELQQNLFRDDRRNVLASTQAALDYLTRLFNMFGDWHLALAAYNWGEGNVQRAIKRNLAAGKPADYASLRMPDETRNYVPKLQAVKNIVLDPQAFGLTLIVLENHPYFVAVPIERDIDVALVSQLAGLPPEQFAQLNPQFNKPVILAAGTPQLLLPYDNANTFVKNLQRHPGPLASWTAWTVPRNLDPAAAAAMVGMSESQLREVNRIPPRVIVRAGSTLLVPRDDRRAADVPPEVADNATIALLPTTPPRRRVAYTVGSSGATVAAVAKRFGVAAADVASWNNVSASARLRPGAQVVVYVPQRTAHRPAASKASKAAPARRAAAPAAATARTAAPAPKASSAGAAKAPAAKAPAARTGR